MPSAGLLSDLLFWSQVTITFAATSKEAAEPCLRGRKIINRRSAIVIPAVTMLGLTLMPSSTIAQQGRDQGAACRNVGTRLNVG